MNNSYIHKTAIIYENVTIGDNVYIGPNCIIGDTSYQLNANIERNTIIGNNTKIFGGTVICKGAILSGNNRVDHQCYIGENSLFGLNSVLEYGGRVYERVLIGKNTFISGFICNDAKIGDFCIIQGDLIHKFTNVNLNINEISPIVKNNVFVGRNTQVIGGITLSEGSYIGAGSVLTSNTEPGKLYLGIPATCTGIAPKIFSN